MLPQSYRDTMKRFYARTMQRLALQVLSTPPFPFVKKKIWISPSESVAAISKGAEYIAKTYPQLRRDSFEEFIEDAYDAGLEMNLELGRKVFEILKKSRIKRTLDI